MKLRVQGNAIAIALAASAVVLAATGTAYAVAASKVNIADPTNPSHVAAVDASGRLTTIGAKSTINTSTNVGFDTTLPVSSPTTATLAVTSLAWSNPALNSAYTGTTYNVNLVKIHAGSTGSCAIGENGVYIERYLGGRLLDPGDDIEITYPAPLLIRPAAGNAYCLGITFSHLGGAQTSLYLSTFQLTAFVVNGRYTGIGIGASAGVAPGPTTLVSR